MTENGERRRRQKTVNTISKKNEEAGKTPRYKAQPTHRVTASRDYTSVAKSTRGGGARETPRARQTTTATTAAKKKVTGIHGGRCANPQRRRREDRDREVCTWHVGLLRVKEEEEENNVQERRVVRKAIEGVTVIECCVVRKGLLRALFP